MRFKERRRGQTGAAGHALGQNLETPHRAAGAKGSRTPQPACFKSAKRNKDRLHLDLELAVDV